MSFAVEVGALWEATGFNTSMWNDRGHLFLGCLEGKRRRKVPAAYKRAIIYETRNSIGQGVTHPRQLLVGLKVAKKVGATQLMTLQQRKKLVASAPSQGHGPSSDKSLAARCETFQCFNYLVDQRFNRALHYN